MSLKEDQHYISRTIAGDTNAFSVLIDRYKHMVYTLAIRMVKNKEVAEEVAQDTFLKAFQKLPAFQGDAKFSTWLYKIGYHRSLDELKKKHRQFEANGIELSEIRGIAHTEEILESIELKERRSIIKHTIQKLAPDDAAVLTLFYFEELSLEEISEITGTTSNTIKVRLFRSRKRLAALLVSKLEPETLKSYGKG